MALFLRKEGLMTSVQGLGTYGMQRYGINPRGAMDRFAARVANILVGNPETDPVLEAYFPGPEIEFTKAVRFALTGADFAAHLDGSPLPNWSAVSARSGQVLDLRQKISGACAYLAIEGGIEISNIDEPVNSARRLSKGTKLVQCRKDGSSGPRSRLLLSHSICPRYGVAPRVRAVEGAEFSELGPNSVRAFGKSVFTVTNDSNRMGYRLSGPPLNAVTNTEMLSAAVTFGTIQLLPDGQLIVLMADHQTSGGYPRVANVITADLPLLAQLSSNDSVSFEIVDLEVAEAALAQIESDIARLRVAVELHG
ncbi:MAG TPA: biotin-dependent carboxyltransferase family protein [Pyrinomonadaceae bacterium]|nr:biotin-dependent carboxyltransferase family protein [Pyrinomonadaceae bacterium]